MARKTTDDKHYKAIANEIRINRGVNTTYKPEEMAWGVMDTYMDGIWRGLETEHEDFWNCHQDFGNRRLYSFAFAGEGWDSRTFAPVYPLIVEFGYSMFRSCGEIDDFVAILNFRGVYMDTSKARSLEHAFGWSGIKHLGVIDTNTLDDLYHVFSQASKLETVDELKLRQYGGQTFNSTFLNCTSLKNITISGKINKSINFLWSPLTVDSMKSIIEHLTEFSETAYYAWKNTLTFSDACWEALEASGPAPDGGTWRDYVMYTLRWNI